MIPTRLLPEWARAEAFIAGGFAACPALAEDVDVWVPIPWDMRVAPFDTMLFASAWDATYAARAALATYLRDTFGAAYVPQDEPGTVRGDNAGWARNRLLSTAEGYVMPIPIYRAGTVTGLGPLPYHVIAVGGDVDEVLSSFDISTHQVALHPERGLVKGEHWTPITERGFVLKHKYSTASRIEKLAKRYGWPDAKAQ